MHVAILPLMLSLLNVYCVNPLA